MTTFDQFIIHFKTVEQAHHLYGTDALLFMLKCGTWFNNPEKRRIELIHLSDPVLIKTYLDIQAQKEKWVMTWIDYDDLSKDPRTAFVAFVRHRLQTHARYAELKILSKTLPMDQPSSNPVVVN